MPYEIRETDGKFCVHKKGEDAAIHRHESREDAEAQMRAMYASEADKALVTIKSQTAETATIAGYGVVFGGFDLDSDTFTKDTELDLDLVPAKRVFYDHTLGEVKHSLGKVVKAVVDETGVWIEAELERSRQYVNEVLKLIEKGVLGWSSGSVPHLVRRENGIIKSWPVVEFSLTPTPCEPRTLGVDRIKTLAEEDPTFKALLPQGAGDAPAGASESEPEAVNADPIKTQEVTTMPEFNTDDLVTKILDRLSEKLPELKTVQKEVSPEKPWKSFGEYLTAVRAAGQGNRDARLSEVKDLTNTANGGGFLVPESFRPQLLSVAQEASIVRKNGAMVIPMASDVVSIPRVNETTRASTLFGGVAAYWVAEGGSYTESQPAIGQMQLNAKKLIGYTQSSDELLQDSAVGLEALLVRLFGEAIAFNEDYAFLSGTGAGQPLGIINSPALIAITAESGQGSSTIVYQNIVKMYARMLPSSLNRAVWIADIGTFPQLAQLNLAVGTGGAPAWLPAGGLSGLPYPTLMGRPLLFTEKLPALGTKGDLLFADLGYYVIGDRRQLSVESSIHVAFSTGLTTWRFQERVDGQPWIASAITPKNSGDTLSPFVSISSTRT